MSSSNIPQINLDKLTSVGQGIYTVEFPEIEFQLSSEKYHISGPMEVSGATVPPRITLYGVLPELGDNKEVIEEFIEKLNYIVKEKTDTSNLPAPIFLKKNINGNANSMVSVRYTDDTEYYINSRRGSKKKFENTRSYEIDEIQTVIKCEKVSLRTGCKKLLDWGPILYVDKINIKTGCAFD